MGDTGWQNENINRGHENIEKGNRGHGEGA